MAEAQPVVPIGTRRVPERVRLDGAMPAFSPRELEAVEDFYGASFEELTKASQKNRVVAWLTARRLGYDDLTLEDMGDVLIEVDPDALPPPGPAT